MMVILYRRSHEYMGTCFILFTKEQNRMMPDLHELIHDKTSQMAVVVYILPCLLSAILE